ncbi:MAG: hypothetical protein MUC48_02855 [Leptolyngbya sp. Prado105]|nr:hypothetical protein [Leptolyngbya sp. Prado105]
MTSIDTSHLDQAIVKFQSLSIEEQLATLGLLSKEISGAISVNAFGADTREEIAPLIDQVQGQRQDEQLQTLSDFLSSKTEQGDEVALDPHPSKALLELIPGNVEPALTRYKSLRTNSRLALWYQLAQQMGNSIPANFSLSPQADELLTSLRSLSTEQQERLLSQIV